MPTNDQSVSSQTITLACAGPADQAIGSVWPGVEAYFAEHGQYAAPQIVTVHEACSLPAAMLEPAVLALLEPDPELAAKTAAKLADHLAEQNIPAVLLAPEAAGLTGAIAPGVIAVAAEHATPERLGAFLEAFVSSGDAMRTLRAELFNARRAQGGASGEIQRLHEEMALASAVQHAMLPEELPAVEGFDLGVLFRPASYVSGDIYDIRRIDEHHLRFYLADAVGHGVPAALITMVLARAFQSVQERAMPEILSPADVLHEVNGELIRRSGDHPHFASAVYGVIDTRDLVLTIAGAGHPPSMVYDPRQPDPKLCRSAGGLLGVFEGDSFDQHEVQLRPGQVLIIHSDGFELAFAEEGAEMLASGTRTPQPSNLYIKWFADTAKQAIDRGVSPALEWLGAGLDQQDGSLHQLDDVTALAIGLGTPGAHAAHPVRRSA
ncbi:MAG: PP2C family protein-serine/threonine phosphatase [Planctomycetota bacterium]